MKRLIKNYIWMLLAVPLAFTGCSEDKLDEINKNINDPQDVQAKFILADVLTNTAVNNSGGDINTYLTTYTEHEAGIYNQMYYSEIRLTQPSSASTFNNSWGSLYRALRDAKIIIAKCSEGGIQEGNDVTKGMAEVMAAYNLALLTDLFGDVPWTEALDYQSTFTPKLDKQEAIYGDIMAYLDAAIVDLQGEDNHPSGSAGTYDLLYNGDAEKWLKFAHGLKARYLMHLINRSSNVNADLQEIINEVDASFESPEEQAAFSIYNDTQLSPTFDFQYSRDALAASRSMADKLIARNDPRLRRVFVKAYASNGSIQQIPTVTTGDANYELMAPNGETEQIQFFYNSSVFMSSQTAPTQLLSYHEIMFLRAEAMARLNNTAATITPYLRDAFLAAIANTELSIDAAENSALLGGALNQTTAPITQSEAGTYFDTTIIPLLVANPLQEIMMQKYLAFFGASGETTESYNDIRRLKALGEDFIPLANEKPFPLRLPYGNDDTTTNPNVQTAYGDGQYVYTEPVWWAGGTR